MPASASEAVHTGGRYTTVRDARTRKTLRAGETLG
jgi:hypothetical protein